MRKEYLKFPKKLFKFALLLLLTFALVFGAWITFYKFEQLIEIGKPILKELDEYGFSRARWQHILGLIFGVLWAATLLFLTQFFLSLYENTVKKEFDEIAENLTKRFEKWYKK